MSAPIVEYRGISKHFSGIRALEDVDFACHSGTIHAILGENGAGKSTLIKIMSGVLTPDTGEMLLEGNVMPQLISVPLPVATFDELEDGKNYWTDLPDNFFTVNEFPPCGVNITGPAIMAQSEEDVK